MKALILSGLLFLLFFGCTSPPSEANYPDELGDVDFSPLAFEEEVPVLEDNLTISFEDIGQNATNQTNSTG